MRCDWFKGQSHKHAGLHGLAAISTPPSARPCPQKVHRAEPTAESCRICFDSGFVCEAHPHRASGADLTFANFQTAIS
jgi:hypothetical protein